MESGSAPSPPSRPQRPRPRWIEDVERLDHAVYAAIAGTPTPTIDRAMSLLSPAADYGRLSLGSAAALGVAGGPAGRQAALGGLASLGLTATVVNAVVRPLGRRRRPDPVALDVPLARQVKVPTSRSFPSGHSAGAFAFATGVGNTMPRAGSALRSVAFLVAYSRVHTGVHYPVDVLAGALLGTTLAQLATHQLSRRGVLP